MSFPQQEQEERVRTLASSIELQLNAMFPQGFSLDDPEESSRLQECFLHLEVGPPCLADEPPLSSIYKKDELKRAIAIAVRQWKKAERQDNTTSGPVKSFSLLDQFASGRFGLPVVDVEEILQMPTVPERLEKLQKIQYLEDVLTNWKDIRSMLQSGLQYDATANEGDASSERSKLDVTMAYLKLHRQWFHEARASSEYLGVQYDLCNNLSQCIAKMLELFQLRNDDSNQWMFDLIRNWHDMFFDMMQRDQYSADVAKNIESSFLLCLKSHPYDETGQDDVVSPAQMLALIDPQAHCFATWIHHMSPQRLVTLLDQAQLLPVLWGRCKGSSEDRPLTRTLFWQSLSMLTFVLVKARVAMFPWHLLVEINKTKPMAVDDGQLDDSLTINATQEQVLDLFLECLLAPDSVEEEWRQQVCCNAIETILSGKSSDVSATTRSQLFNYGNKLTVALSKLRDDLGKDKWVVRHLEDVVSEMEGGF